MLMLPTRGKNKLIKDSTEVVAYVIKFKTETKTPNENKLMFQNYEIANNEITNQSKGNWTRPWKEVAWPENWDYLQLKISSKVKRD